MIAPLTFRELRITTPEQVAAFPHSKRTIFFLSQPKRNIELRLKREAKKLAAWERRNAIRAAHIAATREAQKLARTFHVVINSKHFN